MLLYQRTGVWIPEPTFSGSQMIVTPAPRGSNRPFWGPWTPAIYVNVQKLTQINEIKHISKKEVEMEYKLSITFTGNIVR